MPAKTGLAMDQAIAWHLRSASMDEDQWQEFIAWLERSADNRSSYDRVAETDQLLGQLQFASPDAAAGGESRSLRRFLGKPGLAIGAVAAAIVALANWSLQPSQAPMQVEQTEAGTTKQIAFAEGTRIDLNGETRMILEPSRPREVRLESGEALFSVHHSNQPFVVEAGGFRIKDLGTIFNVQVSAKSLDLDVREGRVLFDPGGANLTVGVGEKVSVDRTRNVIVKTAAVATSNWPAGELAFDNSSVSAVAAAMHRRSGIVIRLSEGLSNVPFTGNIRLSGDEETDAAHFASLIGASYRREDGGWVLSARGGPR